MTLSADELARRHREREKKRYWADVELARKKRRDHYRRKRDGRVAESKIRTAEYAQAIDELEYEVKQSRDARSRAPDSRD